MCAFERRSGKVGGEPYQRAFHIVKDTGPFAHRRSVPGHEDIVATGPSKLRQKQPGRLSQAALGPVSHNGAADPLGGGKSGSDGGIIIIPGPQLNYDGALGPVSAFCGRQKLGPLGQASN